jgi:hypothetical protein
MYRHGIGVAQDYQQALNWYQKAADQGDSDAQFYLGVHMLYDSDDYLQDNRQAVYWLRKAAEQGNVTAQEYIGGIYLLGTDTQQGIYWSEKAAEQGSILAADALGKIYEEGKFGVAQDYQKAVRWYRKAVEQDEDIPYARIAQYDLGYMYQYGRGVVQDYQQALSLYHRSAKVGYVDAIVQLSDMYRNGYGVDRNDLLAYTLSVIASTKGNKTALSNKSIYEKLLNPSQIKEGLALAKAWKEGQPLPNHVMTWKKPLEANAEQKVIQPKSNNVPDQLIQRQSNSRYPEAPAAKSGYTTCRTNCFNGDCYRTYSNGQQVHFQAKRKFNPFNGQWEWDSGGC